MDGNPLPPKPQKPGQGRIMGPLKPGPAEDFHPQVPREAGWGWGALKRRRKGGRGSGRRGGSEWGRGLTEREQSQRVAQRRGGGSKGEGVSEVGSKRGKAPRGVGHLGLRTPQRGPAAILEGFQEAWPASPWESPSHRHPPTWRSGPWTPRVDGQRD